MLLIINTYTDNMLHENANVILNFQWNEKAFNMQAFLLLPSAQLADTEAVISNKNEKPIVELIIWWYGVLVSFHTMYWCVIWCLWDKTFVYIMVVLS